MFHLDIFFLVSYHLSNFHSVTSKMNDDRQWLASMKLISFEILLGIWAFSFFSSLPHLLPRIFCVHVCSVMSDSLKPHGWQPTRLLCPWKFLGKSTGVDCYSYSRGYYQPRHQTTSPELVGRFLTTVPLGKIHTSYFSRWLHGFFLCLFCFIGPFPN